MKSQQQWTNKWNQPTSALSFFDFFFFCFFVFYLKKKIEKESKIREVWVLSLMVYLLVNLMLLTWLLWLLEKLIHHGLAIVSAYFRYSGRSTKGRRLIEFYCKAYEWEMKTTSFDYDLHNQFTFAAPMFQTLVSSQWRKKKFNYFFVHSLFLPLSAVALTRHLSIRFD